MYRDLPVYAVGQNTADAARKAGLSVAQVGQSGVDAVLGGLRSLRLLWLVGEDHLEVETDKSVRIDKQVVYRSTVACPPTDFDEIVRSADYILLHSPRAALRLAELLSERDVAKGAISVAALSPNIAQAAGGGWRSVRVASQPTDAALLSQL